MAMRSTKFTAPEKEVEKTMEGQLELDADALNKKRMAKFEDVRTACTERAELQRLGGQNPMTQSRVVTQVSGPGRSRGAAMDGAAMNSSHDREAIQYAAADMYYPTISKTQTEKRFLPRH
jgi:hypothetical protein